MAQKIKVKTPRTKRAVESHAHQNSTAGEVADSVARQLMYAEGQHTLAHEGEILQRGSRLLDLLNYQGAKAQFELVLR